MVTFPARDGTCLSLMLELLRKDLGLQMVRGLSGLLREFRGVRAGIFGAVAGFFEAGGPSLSSGDARRAWGVETRPVLIGFGPAGW